MEPDYFETCKELAALCIKENDPEHSAYLIQLFCEELHKGETPWMALLEAKLQREGNDINDPPHPTTR